MSNVAMVYAHEPGLHERITYPYVDEWILECIKMAITMDVMND